ncbi:integral membrane sensor signal transduction histidine kinase [Rhodomicrobium vannielii ATCC 17100]|uniref:histidine kinase n=1 Tax=Rhodomicrobium vannielii (strain ATCC 17100 / DSM 162 / LMG 4299 / NCIMB 10020 / ATH 3.1.1) TaxID=648757 RepID=E3HZW7_RHOVT|nr:sensor histidine kinase [Rhodomicrobium vannielii]ADP69918.1 integral membrane sensor signal transduction histidine kinase [Rhodomicrobium vannielii ATCC 17100]
MTGSSLRLRLIVGGMAAILLALTVAGGGLVHLFERHVARTIADDLNLHLSQILAALDVNADGTLVLTRKPGDPRFEVPLSGLYWQVSNDRDQLLRSRSLWDATLPIAADAISPGEEHRHVLQGPGRDEVLAAERSVVLTVGDRKMPVRVAVAASLAGVSKASAAFTRDLAIALAILGAVLTGATILQVSLGLRPLDRLRRGVADIRAGRIVNLPTAVPSEVQPLVEEMNALIDSQVCEIERSRGRAADLAHGLKTPLAALSADARRLRGQGEKQIADDIEGVVAAMGRHVDRELARARVRGVGGRSVGRPTPLAPLLASLIATLGRTSEGARVVFETRQPPEFAIPMDRTDLAEVLGNLLENAARHASTRVLVSAAADDDGAGLWITVEDDGAGIAPELRDLVMERGIRLDERERGTGLGLAIVQDVLDAYGWRLLLDASSALGGLKATIATGPKAGS